jgi:co-chaperonin GroES (HSP10)
MTTVLNPIKDKIYLAKNKKESTTVGGIYLEEGNGDSWTATVLAIGPDVTDCKVGDKVLLDWSKASEVKVDNAFRVICKQEHIVAVFEE